MLELTKELLEDEPKKMAETLLSSGSKTTSTQMRKFYDDFLLLKKKMQGLGDVQFTRDILPLVRFAKAKMAYNVGRQSLPASFKKEMDGYIDKIETKNDFEHFILFYQALIAYTKYGESQKSQPRFDSSSNRMKPMDPRRR